MKKFLAIVCILVLLCAAGGWYAYNNWKTGPAYSLMQAGLALKNNDKAAIEKYVDLDGVINNAVDIFVEEGIKQAKKDSDNDMMIAMAGGFLAAMKPAIVSAMKEGVLQAIDNANKDEKAAENQKKLQESIKIKSVKTIKKEGDIASVELIMDIPEKQNVRFVLGMKRYADYWKVEKLENPQENILKWLEEEMNKPQANANTANVQEEDEIVVDLTDPNAKLPEGITIE